MRASRTKKRFGDEGPLAVSLEERRAKRLSLLFDLPAANSDLKMRQKEALSRMMLQFHS